MNDLGNIWSQTAHCRFFSSNHVLALHDDYSVLMYLYH